MEVHIFDNGKSLTMLANVWNTYMMKIPDSSLSNAIGQAQTTSSIVLTITLETRFIRFC